MADGLAGGSGGSYTARGGGSSGRGARRRRWCMRGLELRGGRRRSRRGAGGRGALRGDQLSSRPRRNRRGANCSPRGSARRPALVAARGDPLVVELRRECVDDFHVGRLGDFHIGHFAEFSCRGGAFHALRRELQWPIKKTRLIGAVWRTKQLPDRASKTQTCIVGGSSS